MSVSLNIAASGLDAAQTAMDTIAENLSNANTPGYVAETANLTTNPGGDPLGVGDGVRVTSVSQSSDGLLVANAQQSSGALAQSSALQQVLQQAQLSFQEPSSTGLSAALSSFWQSWDQVASNPGDPAGRQQVIEQAKNLTTDLHQSYQQLQTTATNANDQLSSIVKEANGLLSQVANLNVQITTTQSSGGAANSLIDQRNQIVDQLAKDIGATGSTQPDGTYQVQTGGVTLVSGGWSDQVQSATVGTSEVLQAKNSGATLSATAGAAAGLLAGINQYITPYQNQLDAVANSLAQNVNSVLESGYTYTPAPPPVATGAALGTAAKGTPLFVPDSGSGITAQNISVSSSIAGNPMLIAASSTSSVPYQGVPNTTDSPDASNDGSNAQAVANLWDTTSTTSPVKLDGPDSIYRSLVQGVGQDVSTVNNQVQAQTSVANAAQQNLQAAAGVDQNQQMISLISFQQSFQASAKVISTVDSAMQSLLASV